MTRRNNSGEVPAGHPQDLPRGARGAVVVTLAILLGAGISACGGGDVSGARVGVYVAAPYCSAAKTELKAHGAAAGNYTVAVLCLASSAKAGGGIDLATAGANSRRATEDTSAVATLEPPGPTTKFTRPILEAAGIPLETSSSPRKGMQLILEAVESAGSSDPRGSVQKSLQPS